MNERNTVLHAGLGQLVHTTHFYTMCHILRNTPLKTETEPVQWMFLLFFFSSTSFNGKELVVRKCSGHLQPLLKQQQKVGNQGKVGGNPQPG